MDYETAAASNKEIFRQYFHYCLEHGIYLPPSPFETWFISYALSDEDIEKTVITTRNFVTNL